MAFSSLWSPRSWPLSPLLCTTTSGKTCRRPASKQQASCNKGLRASRSGLSKRLLVGAGLGALTLWLTLRGIDLTALVGALGHAGVPGVVASLVLVVATVATAAWRWQFLLFPRGAPPGAN